MAPVNSCCCCFFTALTLPSVTSIPPATFATRNPTTADTAEAGDDNGSDDGWEEHIFVNSASSYQRNPEDSESSARYGRKPGHQKYVFTMLLHCSSDFITSIWSLWLTKDVQCDFLQCGLPWHIWSLINHCWSNHDHCQSFCENWRAKFHACRQIITHQSIQSNWPQPENIVPTGFIQLEM